MLTQPAQKTSSPTHISMARNCLYSYWKHAGEWTNIFSSSSVACL